MARPRPGRPSSEELRDKHDPEIQTCADFGKDADASIDQPVRAAAYFGFEREDAPTVPPSADVAAALRWIHLNSNLRLASIYLQGPAPAGVNVDSNTDPRNDLRWMGAVTEMTRVGWGLAPLYVGITATNSAGTLVDAALGESHAEHVKTTMALLQDAHGFDLSGSVVYVRNFDHEGRQMYELGRFPFSNIGEPVRKACRLKEAVRPDYLDYFQAFARALMWPDDKGRAYRFGVFGMPAAVRQVLSVAPEAFVWQLMMEGVEKDEVIKTGAQGGLEIAFSRVLWSPRIQRALVPKGVDVPDRTWPVQRQIARRLTLPVNEPAPAPELEDVSIDASYVFNPANPVASPRLSFVPGTTLLASLRLLPARHQDGRTNWRRTSLKAPTRGALSIVDAAAASAKPVAWLDHKVQAPGDELHPESPVAAARDAAGHQLVTVARLDRKVVIGEVSSGKHNPLKLLPTGALKYPFAMSLACVGDFVAFAHATRTRRRVTHCKWPDGSWTSKDLPDLVVDNVFAALAATGHPKGDQLLVATVALDGTLVAFTGPPDRLAGGPQAPDPDPPLSATSALAAVSPTPDEDLVFGVTRDARLALFSFRKGRSPLVKISAEILFIHTRLAATVIDENTVIVGAVSTLGSLLRFDVVREPGGWRFRGEVVGAGSILAPNPWSDVALAPTGKDKGVAAVAGVDAALDDPERRTTFFVTPLFELDDWKVVPND